MFCHGGCGVGLKDVLAVLDDALVAAVLGFPLGVADGKVLAALADADVVGHVRRVDLKHSGIALQTVCRILLKIGRLYIF